MAEDRKQNKVLLRVFTGKEEKSYPVDRDKTVLDNLRDQGVLFGSDCGGRGTCGKCRVCVLSGSFRVNTEEGKTADGAVTDTGYYLGCQIYPEENLCISLDHTEESMQIVTESGMVGKKSCPEDACGGGWKAAVDIGTTTIAMQLIKGAQVYQNYTAINHQRSFGTDVIRRIQASVDGHGEEMRQMICRQLSKGIRTMCRMQGIGIGELEEIGIAGNTTMEHLLLGYPVKSLGQFPFTPVDIRLTRQKASEVLMDPDIGGTAYILPGISTFVGADIVSGMAVCGFDDLQETALFIDLGTNGEMALGNGEKILVTSTAAGPAFEGGEISCGTGSIPGAICSAYLSGEEICFKTIGDKPPAGLCGTGLISLTAALLEKKIINKRGKFCAQYKETGYPIGFKAGGSMQYLTQKDIVELQMAKAAVSAGAQTLCRNFGITPAEVDRVYLAGGFGYYLNPEEASKIGLFPGEWVQKTRAVGNTSLSGAGMFLTVQDTGKRMEKILEKAEEVSLSTDPFFSECYIHSMAFPDNK